LPGVLLYGIALGGVAQQREPGPGFAAEFLEKTFGLPAADRDAATAIETLHAIAPRIELFRKLCPLTDAERQPLTAAERVQVEHIRSAARAAAAVLQSRRPPLQPAVFAEIVFTARVFARLGDDLSGFQAEARQLWERTRYPAVPVSPNDAFLPRLARS
jgi:hypothetical protein